MSRRIPARVLETLQASAWNMMPEYLNTMLAVVHRATDLEAIEREMGTVLENTHEATVRDGIAKIPICGPMFKFANLFTAISGATSYEMLATDLGAALDNPDVTAIVLDIDSPGGEALGCSELARLIAESRGTKPIIAYVSGYGCSAAYWLAVAADQVIVSDSAIVGSIGTRMTYIDTSEADAKDGVREIEIISSQSPFKGDDNPATESGRAATQRLVDSLAQVFVDAVAEYRGVTAEHVLAHFGQGGVFVGAEALANGMADGIGTYESVHAGLLASASTARPRLAITAREERTMSQSNRLPAPVATIAGSLTPARPAAAFESGAKVRSTVARDVVVDQGAEGSVVEVKDGFYAVDFGAGEYRWLAESELEAVTADEAPATVPPAGDAPAAHTAANLIAAARLAGATAERERILAIEEMSRPDLAMIEAAAKADPRVTADQFARQIVEHDKKSKASHLASLKADESQLRVPAPTPAADRSASGNTDVDRIIGTVRRHSSTSRA